MSGSLLFRVSVPDRPPLLKILNDVLLELNVKYQFWMDGNDDEKQPVKQVQFYLENGLETEEAIKMLTDNEIGVTPNSSIGLFQCYLLYQGSKESSPRLQVTRWSSETWTNKESISERWYLVVELTQEELKCTITHCRSLKQQTHNFIMRDPAEESYSWEKFVESVRPRLVIAEIVDSVKRKASLTFDFVVLLIVAGLTASLGLVEDNQLILASSMFISPMMFPMIATTLGTVIKQWKLQKLGITNGLLGLMVCVFIGFLFGVMASLFQGYKSMNAWPTSLMYSMGTVRALWTGAVLAVLSGTAVSIGILGDDEGAVQGVAISAALLPPAVNAGLLWSRSVLLITFPDLPDNSRQIWSADPPLELALLGAVSLLLSFLNVIFIFIAGNVLLKVKEVASWRQKRDHHWENLKEFKPFTKEETEHLTERLGLLPKYEIRTHHWTVSPNIFQRQQIMRGLETWSGCSRDTDHRPTAQDLAHHMLAPKRTRALAQEFRASQGSTSNFLGVPNETQAQQINDVVTPPSSRFTVVPVHPS